MIPNNLYPSLSIDRIENPSRFYAFPLIGILVKIVMLVPVMIGLSIIVGLLSIFYLTVNSFVVLFTGKYWNGAYNFFIGFMRYYTKIHFFVNGLTNKYPGFQFAINDAFSVDMPKPENPSKLFAIPLLGGTIRIVMLIPFLIYYSTIYRAGEIGAFFSSIPVLFSGKYPESTFELARDSIRVGLAGSAYLLGLSDKYPNFWISMNHKVIKIILIILGALAMIGNISSVNNKSDYKNRYNSKYFYNNITTPSVPRSFNDTYTR